MVAKLGASNVLHESEVEASNWMSALRAARVAMSERPSVPPGASCSIDAQGVATVLDPGSRRKFVLAPLAPGAAPREDRSGAPAEQPPSQGKQKRFQTVAMIPERPPAATSSVAVTGPTGSHTARHSIGMPAPDPRAQPAEGSPSRESAERPPAAPSATPPGEATKKKRFQTVGFSDQVIKPPAARPAPASVAARADSRPLQTSQRPLPELELLLERDEEPSADNPLCYRERAYLLPRNATVPEAEASLRWKLAELQQQLSDRPRGKFLNLAVFDHRWQDVPERPPVIVLQWRDWRDEVTVDYPAAARVSSLPPPSRQEDDRLPELFEALEALPRQQSAADGLDFAVRLLERTIPCEAICACLYDINTDELRFVALAGAGAVELQGQAVPRGAGLFGAAARNEDRATVFADVRVEPAFDPAVDGRPGIDARNVLLRPITRDHQLLGMVQLMNRRDAAAFSAEDINAVSYVAERLAEFLHATRVRRRSIS